MKEGTEEETSSVTTLVTVALVLRTPLEAVSRLKEAVEELQMTKIVYQRVSVGHLKIVEANEGGEK